MSKRWISAALVALALAACSGEPSTLEAVIDPAGETTGFGSFTTGTDKGFGVFICTSGGEVDIQDVTPAHTEGEVEFLGAQIYTSPDRFVGAADGYPPDGLDESLLETVPGAVVDADCEEPEGDDRVQIIIGAERTGSGGGVLDGFVVSYGDDQELEIPFTILLCGDELEYCEALIPAETTTTTPADS